MEAGRETFERVADGIHRQRRTTPRYSRQPISARTSARTGEERYKRILPCRGCRQSAGNRPARGSWARPLPLRIRQRLHAHARAQAARRRKPRIALGHGMAVPAPVVARTARGTGHTTVDEPQGQLPGQRRHRTGVRPSQGRVLPRPRIRLVRAVQGRARRLHHPLEHQTTPDTTRWTHPGGILAVRR